MENGELAREPATEKGWVTPPPGDPEVLEKFTVRRTPRHAPVLHTATTVPMRPGRGTIRCLSLSGSRALWVPSGVQAARCHCSFAEGVTVTRPQKGHPGAGVWNGMRGDGPAKSESSPPMSLCHPTGDGCTSDRIASSTTSPDFLSNAFWISFPPGARRRRAPATIFSIILTNLLGRTSASPGGWSLRGSSSLFHPGGAS